MDDLDDYDDGFLVGWEPPPAGWLGLLLVILVIAVVAYGLG